MGNNCQPCQRVDFGANEQVQRQSVGVGAAAFVRKESVACTCQFQLAMNNPIEVKQFWDGLACSTRSSGFMILRTWYWTPKK
jgi:hypothetical protein